MINPMSYETQIQNSTEIPNHGWRWYTIIERVSHNFLKSSDRVRIHQTTVLATGHRWFGGKDYFYEGEVLVYAVNSYQVDRLMSAPGSEPENEHRVWRQEIQDEFVDADAYVSPSRRGHS